MTEPSMHDCAAVAKRWHEDQALASRVFVDVDDQPDGIALFEEERPQPHDEMAEWALDVLTERYGDEAIGLTIWTVAPSGRSATEWRVRWYDECRTPTGHKLLWVEELRRVTWCPRCESASQFCRCDEVRSDLADWEIDAMASRSVW